MTELVGIRGKQYQFCRVLHSHSNRQFLKNKSSQITVVLTEFEIDDFKLIRSAIPKLN